VTYSSPKKSITINIPVDSEVNGWFYPRLTADGRNCITEYGVSVSDFLRSRNRGTTYHFSDNSRRSRCNCPRVAHGRDEPRPGRGEPGRPFEDRISRISMGNHARLLTELDCTLSGTTW
jgi:hypothetical protein